MPWSVRFGWSSVFDLFLILWFPGQFPARFEITGSPVESAWLTKEMENTANLVRKSKLFIFTNMSCWYRYSGFPVSQKSAIEYVNFNRFVVILGLKSCFHSAQIGEMQGGSSQPEYPRLEVTGKRFKLNLNLVDGFKRTSCQSSERTSFLTSRPCPERRDSSTFLWPMVR